MTNVKRTEKDSSRLHGDSLPWDHQLYMPIHVYNIIVGSHGLYTYDDIGEKPTPIVRS